MALGADKARSAESEDRRRARRVESPAVGRGKHSNEQRSTVIVSTNF